MTLQAILRRDDDPGDETVLTAVPETPQAAPGEGAGQAAAPGHALITPGGERVNPADQVIAAIRYGWRNARRQAKDMSAREGGWVNASLNFRPASVNDQRDYLANRRWLPPGHEEGIADRIGEAYYAGIAIPAAALVNAAGWWLKRLYRFLCALVITLGAVFLATTLTAGLPQAALVTAALFSVATGYLGLIAALLAARRAIGRRRP
jgi:hypothetical protein